MLIFFLPVIGAAIYLVTGMQILGRRRIKRRERSRRLVRDETALEHFKPYRIGDITPTAIGHPSALMEHITSLPTLIGNDVQFTGDSAKAWDRLLSDIANAKHHVHLMYYIVLPDAAAERLCDALLAAAKRGLHVRFLLDAVGSSAFLGSDLRRRLEEGGVQVQELLSVKSFRVFFERFDVRNHRKLVVIDGEIGHCGSMNLADPQGDTMEGQAENIVGFYRGPVVDQLQLVFAEDWEAETDELLKGHAYYPYLHEDRSGSPVGSTAAHVVPSSPGDRHGRVAHVLMATINEARERVIITTPYFVPDEPMLVAIQLAAMRGVQVDLVVPRKTDHPLVDAAGRSYFSPLLEVGVRIHHFTHGLLHSKTVTIDNLIATLGSANFDIRSFEINYELNVMLFGEKSVNQLRQIQEQYIERSELIGATAWRHRPRLQRTIDHLAALGSPLL